MTVGRGVQPPAHLDTPNRYQQKRGNTMMPEDLLPVLIRLALAAWSFCLLYAGHRVGDTWAQRGIDAVRKQETGFQGGVHCLVHVLMLTATKAAFLVPGLLILGAGGLVSWGGVALALTLAGVLHYLVDRGRPLYVMARATGQIEFIERVSVVRTPGGPADTRGPGTGAFELDQAWHVACLVPAALIIAGFSA